MKWVRRAQTDPLTGLFNREYMEREVQAYLGEKGERHSSALAIFDLDNFKQVNDLCGHLEGDRVLCMLASVLRKHFGGADIVGRLGGDEFTVLWRTWRQNRRFTPCWIGFVRRSERLRVSGRETAACPSA